MDFGVVVFNGCAGLSPHALKLGTAVYLVTERDTITTAKEVASLDLLSGGRFLFGVGSGWNRLEMANHGTRPGTRMAARKITLVSAKCPLVPR